MTLTRPPRRSAALFTAAWLMYAALSVLIWTLCSPAAWALATFMLVIVGGLLAKSEHDADAAERRDYDEQAQAAIRSAYLQGRADRPVSL